jgi:UDP-2,3-diacylglucosamine pyrophosphatase LpxH
MKTYVFSDSHFGNEYSDYDSILKFFDLVQKDADELIGLGDIFDLWTNDFENISTQQPYKEAYEQLIETSRTVRTELVAGNHDYNIKKYIKNPNIIITPRFTRDNVHFCHGYEMDVLQLAAYPYYGWILLYCPYLYQKYFYHPKKLMYSQNDLINDIAREYAEKRGYKRIIYGHTHLPMISEDELLINPGDFVKHASYVVLDEGKPYLRNI